MSLEASARLEIIDFVEAPAVDFATTLQLRYGYTESEANQQVEIVEGLFSETYAHFLGFPAEDQLPLLLEIPYSKVLAYASMVALEGVYLEGWQEEVAEVVHGYLTGQRVDQEGLNAVLSRN